MSLIQTLGVLVSRSAMLFLFGVITICAALVTWKNVGFAWSQADGIGMGILLVIGAIALEIAKDWLPVVFYNQRHDAPRMATWVFCVFVVLLVLSYSCSMYYENVDGTNRPSNILLFISHIFAAGGPVVWNNASKWIEERPTDGLPRMPAELFAAPMQQDAIAAPQRTMLDGFCEWAPRVISQDPEGQVSLTKALESYNAWASANGYPTADVHAFEPLMAEATVQSGGRVVNGFFMDVSLVSEPHYLAVH